MQTIISCYSCNLFSILCHFLPSFAVLLGVTWSLPLCLLSPEVNEELLILKSCYFTFLLCVQILLYLRNLCPSLASLSLREVSWEFLASQCFSLPKSISLKFTISLLSVILLGYHSLNTVTYPIFCLNSLSSLPKPKIKSRIFHL